MIWRDKDRSIEPDHYFCKESRKANFEAQPLDRALGNDIEALLYIPLLHVRQGFANWVIYNTYSFLFLEIHLFLGFDLASSSNRPPSALKPNQPKIIHLSRVTLRPYGLSCPNVTEAATAAITMLYI